MKNRNSDSNYKMISKLMLRLLPVHVLILSLGTFNSIVSSFFSANYVGIEVTSAIGLYGPISMMITAVGAILSGGAGIECGKYIGQNSRDEVAEVFSMDIILTVISSFVITAVLLFMSLNDLTGIFTRDSMVRVALNNYFLGQAIGVLPLLLSNQLSVFLSFENREKFIVLGSISWVVVNLFFEYIFVLVIPLGAFGLALASSLGTWIFCVIEAMYFLLGRSYIRFVPKKIDLKKSIRIITKGLPGVLPTIYGTVRGFLVNGLIDTYVGSAGLSALAAAGNLMGLFWAVPVGMLSVSRLLISIGVGEEDRNSLKSVMHFMFTGYLALQSIISLGIISLSIPFTRIFYQNPVEPVYMMTAWGFRILPLCMPLSIICMHFIAYAQATDKHVLLNLLAVFDGVLGVAITAPLLIGRFGINAIYIANVLNGVITTLIIFLYAFVINRHVPRNIGELMVIPEDFGVPDDAVVVIEVKNMEHVVEVAKNVQHFCEERGIDRKRAMLAGLSLEEMAGNVVTHGFSMDDRKHTVIVKAIHRNNDVILTIKDDCLAFDPAARNDINDLEDPTRYIGIRMIFKIASEVNYQNVLGLNFLTIRI